MPIAQCADLRRCALAQLLAGVVAHCFEHPVALAAIRPLVGHEQRLAGQLRQQVKYLVAVQSIARADGFSCLERPATREHRQSLEQAPLRSTKKVVAPAEGRRQRLLTRKDCATAAGQQLEPLVEPTSDLFGGERVDPRRGKLQCKRNAVETSTDLHDR